MISRFIKILIKWISIIILLSVIVWMCFWFRYQGIKDIVINASETGNTTRLRIIDKIWININNFNWEEGLYNSIRKWNWDTAKVLLRNKKNIIEWSIYTPLGSNNTLYALIEKRNIELSKLVIDKWININADIYWDWSTYLMFAVYNRDIDMAKLLIERWADINKKNNKGVRAIDIANNNWDITMFEFLISRWATINKI
jgi:ankyrin repeat protein